MSDWGGVRDILMELIGKDEESKRNDAEIKRIAQEQNSKELILEHLGKVKSKYVFGSFYVFLQVVSGWLLILIGLIVLLFGQFTTIINIAVGIGIIAIGMLFIAIGQFMQSGFDSANNTREILIFLRASQIEELSNDQPNQP